MHDLFLVNSELGAHAETFSIVLDRVAFVLCRSDVLILGVMCGLRVSVFISEIRNSGFSNISVPPDSAVC